jgi:transcriptional regulator with XRE-family HTH domain
MAMPPLCGMGWSRLVGSNIKRLRIARGLSQEQLAGEAGIAMRHLGRIERGEGNPTIESMGKIAAILKVHPRAFLDEPGDE